LNFTSNKITGKPKNEPAT